MSPALSANEPIRWTDPPPGAATQPDRWITANRENARRSTGPRTPAGKCRSSRNALTHGLTASSPVLPSEDPAAYESHCRALRDEYNPKTPTETQLVNELADTSWRLNRVPLLEAGLLDRITAGVDCLDATRAVAALGLHGQRLSRQFQKALDRLREIQAERRTLEERELKRAAALLEMHKVQGIPYDPAEDGFVFSIGEIDAHRRRLIRRNQSLHIEPVRFHAAPERRFAATI